MEALQGWLMELREDITRLCTSMETFFGWLANGIPPWAAYRALISVRLIALDKHPGVSPVGVGETWRILSSQIFIKVPGPEATMACQDEQLCAGLKAGINGAVHGVQAIWGENLTTTDWWFLLVNAKNTFNEVSWVGMMWIARHLWPSVALFFVNCYRHW